MKVKEGIIKLKEKEINNWKSLGGNAQKPKQSKSVTLRKDKNKRLSNGTQKSEQDWIEDYKKQEKET